MPLSPNEELELLQLEEEEYQESLKAPQAAAPTPQQMTPEQIAEADRQFQIEQNRGVVDAGLAGAAQGATFGFSDELGAAKDVAGDYLSGNPLGKKWREYQKMRESANKQLSEESPLAYTGGELAGGVASSLVMPNLGAAKIAGMAGKYAPAAGKFLAGQGESALARMAGKGTTMAIQGAPIGALYGMGASENDMSKPVELAMDTASGAGMGSLTGLAIGASAQGGKEALKKAGGMIEDSNLLRQIREGYRMGEEGINLASGETQERLSLLPNEKSKGFVDRIMATDKDIGRKVGAAIDKAQDSGVVINIDPKIQSVGEKMFDTIFVKNPTLGEFIEPRTAQLLKLIATREKGNLTPTEARALKDQLYKLTDNLAGFNSDTANFARSMGMDLAHEVDTAMKLGMPEYQTAAREFEAFRRMVPETIMGKGTPSEYGKVYMGDLKNPELKLFESTRDMMKKSQLPGESASKEKMAFEQLKRNLNELGTTNPESVKSLGGTPKDVISGLRQDSDRLAAIRQSHGIDPQAGISEAGKGALSGLATTGRGVLVSGANQVGRIAGAASEAAKNTGQALAKSSPAKMGRSLFNIPDDGLQGLAQRLKAKESSALLGDALESALANKNDAGKNAILFKLMQNPEYRNLLREEGLSEEQD